MSYCEGMGFGNKTWCLVDWTAKTGAGLGMLLDLSVTSVN